MILRRIIGKGINLLRRTKNVIFKLTYAHYHDKITIEDNTVLYESYHGKSATCNPYAIFKELYSNPKFNYLKHIWSVDDPASTWVRTFKQEYPHVIFIKRNSLQYAGWLGKAKYLINNVTFPIYFQKKNGQIYINTWHGTPLKTLGKDIKNASLSDHHNVQRNLLHCDYLFTPNQFTSDKLIDSYDINGIFKGTIIDNGYPRIDLMFHADKKRIRAVLGIPENKKIILYAPTWRDEKAYLEADTSSILFQDFERIKNNFPDYSILLKAHSLTSRFFKLKGLENVCVPNWLDTNELLSIVDILITDYSSIFFDYLPTGKPVIFYTYDKMDYDKKRGMYLDLHDMPGPICNNINDVLTSISNIESIHFGFQNKYHHTINKYCYNDDGNATRRFVDIVFLGKHAENSTRITSKKKKILMYASNFVTNGITSSAINLLSNLDYDNNDVTILFGSPIDETVERNLKKLNSNVKIIYRMGTFNFRLLEYFKHKAYLRFGLNFKWMNKIIPHTLYQKEMKRIIGNTDFDIGIDFGGYSSFWATLFAFYDFKKKYIYLHNDIMADSNRKINGKYIFRRNFNVIFHIYKYFDKLICVSDSSLETNKRKLHKYGISNKIVCVHNSINYHYILNSLHNDKIDNFPFIKEKHLLFVTMGRLSPEKDHAKLIRAFSKITEQFDKVQLLIIGDGPLKQKLEDLIHSLRLINKVVLVGQLDNPFQLLNKCDCFILSSNYEGQPMVLLETLVLAKPIIGTDVTGIHGVLKDGYGELVENSEEGLIHGMGRFLTGQIKPKQFNYIQYNKDALAMFYDQICKID